MISIFWVWCFYVFIGNKGEKIAEWIWRKCWSIYHKVNHFGPSWFNCQNKTVQMWTSDGSVWRGNIPPFQENIFGKQLLKMCRISLLVCSKVIKSHCILHTNTKHSLVKRIDTKLYKKKKWLNQNKLAVHIYVSIVFTVHVIVSVWDMCSVMLQIFTVLIVP